MGAVWAITRLTLISAVRRRTPIALILLAVVLGPAMSMLLEGDQRLEGLIKTVMTWNVALISGAMIALTIFLSCNLVGKDIADKQMFMVDAKPVRRWQVLAGKWLGVTLLIGWLLLLAWGATFIVVFAFSAAGRVTMGTWARILFRHGAAALGLSVAAWLVFGRMLHKRWWGYAVGLAVVGCAASAAMALRAVPVRYDARAADMTAVRERLLVSRRSYLPDRPTGIEDAVEKRVQEIRQQVERLQAVDAKAWDRVRDDVRAEMEARQWPIPFVGGEFGTRGGTTFKFAGVPPDADRFSPTVVLRYNFLLRRGTDEGGTGTLRWRLPLRSGMTMEMPTIFQHRKANEVIIPAEAILRDGGVEVTIVNTNGPVAEEPGREGKPAGTMYVPTRGGLELLVSVGRFDANLARGFLLLWIRLAMIAMVGVAVNTFVSGPVTALALVAYVALGLSNADIVKELDPDPIMVKAGLDGSTPGQQLAYSVAKGVLSLAPDFDQTDPVPDLVVGREIPWLRLLFQTIKDVCLRGGVFAFIGVMIFTRRELAKPTAIT